MKDFKYVYGPVPSRRVGLSLGISPIPQKYCNYSCIYCQLGRTNKLTNVRASFFKISDIIKELKTYLTNEVMFDVITIVGEGEPTLFLDLGELIKEIKALTTKPVAVITNGALLIQSDVREELKEADIVLPSLDAYDEESFRFINRSSVSLKFDEVINGLKEFSHNYNGQIWIETMIIKNVNDNRKSLEKIRDILNNIRYDRLYINTPIRPPAEDFVQAATGKSLNRAISILGGTSIEQLTSEGFHSEIEDDYEAVKSIIKRHPMNQHEIEHFLENRKCAISSELFYRLENDEDVSVLMYKGYRTYRGV